MQRREYVTQARYGYGAIDEYRIEITPEGIERSCMRTTVAGITQKLSRSLCIELNSAYSAGIKDTLAAISEASLLDQDINDVIYGLMKLGRDED